MTLSRAMLVLFIASSALAQPASTSTNEPKPRRALAAHKRDVSFVGFTPDGKHLISSGLEEAQRPGGPRGMTIETGVARLWDLAGNSSSTLEGVPVDITTTMSGDDKQWVFTVQPTGSFTTYDVATGKSKSLVATSPDGKAVLEGDKLRYLSTPYDNASSGKTIPLTGIARPVSNFTQSGMFSPDGRTLAMRDKDENIMLWDVPGGRHTFTLPDSNGNWFVFSRDGQTLAVPGRKKYLAAPDRQLGVQLFSVATGRKIGSLEAASDEVIASVVFSPDSRQVASAGIYTLSVFSAATGKKIKACEKTPYEKGPTALIGPPGGTQIRTTTWAIQPRIDMHLVFSPDGRIVAGKCADGTIKLWDVSGGRIMATLKGPPNPAAFKPDGKSAPAPGQRAIPWTMVTTLAAYSPDGRTVAAGLEDGQVLLWDAPGAKPR
ncbi:MAG: WD40 repeat domain-containing protein [Tepidisphaerales bacterium]